MKAKFLLLITSLLLAHGSLKAQLIADISFGYDQTVFDGSPNSPYDTVSDIWGKLKDSSGTLLTGSNSVAGIGYFTATPSSFSADTTIFENFVFLATRSVQVSNGILNLNVTVTNVDVTAANGKQAYLAFFKGITDVTNYANAVELGLVSALTWNNFSGAGAPSPPTLLNYTFGKTTIGAGVLIGSEEDDSRFASGEGFNYLTETAVPEPATYALLFGSLALLYVLRRR
ncbi:MAG: PEP-CTERM sorting domain-containing protein [Verrucomicrobia bacterium]|nr:PEP-CTERM sorting domain-containing protein [Verrucomicrobiota bacterium]